MINQNEITTLTKKLESKHQCDYSDAYIVIKGNIIVVKNIYC